MSSRKRSRAASDLPANGTPYWLALLKIDNIKLFVLNRCGE
jgi:hypothetical protein